MRCASARCGESADQGNRPRPPQGSRSPHGDGRARACDDPWPRLGFAGRESVADRRKERSQGHRMLHLTNDYSQACKLHITT
ncbi:Serine carboxypeptidase K10B2.2 [Zea mays]|uniref:Serine carboxypeptidase K10B2.2 n=1 Tax=Zea mays TaxID=4577 RepID=A0A1D6ML31_MAIZE|nr:Serine carboxypeptidase K10B2.2 [Zea mays]